MDNEINSMISTSVSDAQISLNCMLQSNPSQVKELAKGVLEKIEGREGQASRKKMLKAIIRKADKALKQVGMKC